MYVYSLSRNILQKSHFENLTFSQMTFRGISHINAQCSRLQSPRM